MEIYTEHNSLKLVKKFNQHVAQNVCKYEEINSISPSRPLMGLSRGVSLNARVLTMADQTYIKRNQTFLENCTGYVSAFSNNVQRYLQEQV